MLQYSLNKAQCINYILCGNAINTKFIIANAYVLKYHSLLIISH